MNKAEKHIMHTKAYNEVIKHRVDAVQGRCAMPGRNLAELHKETDKAAKMRMMNHFDKVLTDTAMPAPETTETESSLGAGLRVMLDRDLAELYNVETRALNQAVKRNIDRFPDDFLFRLNKNEWTLLKSQIVISNNDATLADNKVEQLSHKGDQLNNYVEEILHDQNDINQQQDETNNEMALQIEAINDALDQLRAQPTETRKQIGFKQGNK